MTRPAERGVTRRWMRCPTRKTCPSTFPWPGCPHHRGKTVRATSPRHHGCCSVLTTTPFPARIGYLPVIPGPGGDRCRRQDRAGRCPVLRGCPARCPRVHGQCRAERDRSAPTITRRGGTPGDSAGSLTISSNSLSSQSSSSQINAQNCSSTAPELTGVQMFPPSRIASHPLRTPPETPG